MCWSSKSFKQNLSKTQRVKKKNKTFLKNIDAPTYTLWLKEGNFIFDHFFSRLLIQRQYGNKSKGHCKI